MKYIPFDSRDILYKKPFGAVSDNETVTFRILLHDDARCTTAFLKVRPDNGGMEWLEMQPSDYYDEHFRWYTVEKNFDEGLYWYSFCFDSDYGRKDIKKHDGGDGIIGNDGTEWQLTVFSSAFDTPDSLAGGIIYQIFPDRFYCSGTKKEGVPEDRFLRSDYDSNPEYRQGNGPCSLGNDYFGGDLKGITEKLDYLEALGVSIIYLNPIFEAHSNHRYNTADYMKIDPLLGTEEDFKELCAKAKKHGISIVLDGVFSHTGDDSRYFNRYSRYETEGAFNSQSSPYFSWYKFKNWPHSYHAWWGVPSLPETNEENEAFAEFITGDNGVVCHWLRLGAAGWRLDVADELPDSLLDRIRTAAKKENPDAIIIGEVWEDATNKISYGSRRRYLRGNQLDSVMNYPFANAIIGFMNGADAKSLENCVLNICENYPKKALNLLMNHIGTHDTVRILTALGGERSDGKNRAWQDAQRMTPEQIEKAKKLLYITALLQFTLPGIPSIYYGDEAGLEGYGDPFCRKFFPWGKEDPYLPDFYRKLGAFRRSSTVFKDGDFIPVYAFGGQLAFLRESATEKVLICVNRDDHPVEIPVCDGFEDAEIIFGYQPFDGKVKIDGRGFSVLKSHK